MIRSGCALLVSLFLFSCSSDSSSSGGQSETTTLCEKSCAASDAKACPGEPHTGADCRSYCAQVVSSSSAECPSETHEYVVCAAAVPSADLVCTTDHGSDLNGKCQAEETALETCLGGGPVDGG